MMKLISLKKVSGHRVSAVLLTTLIGCVFLSVALSAVTPTYAQSTGPSVTATAGSSSGLNFKIPNPIKAQSITELISFILKLIFKIGIPVIVMFFLWAGFKFIMAQGNPKELETAKRNLWHVIIGTAIFLGAYAITDIIVNTIKNTTGFTPLE